MSECNCRICQRIDRWRKARDARDVDALVKFGEDMMELLANTETDCEVHEAIMRGEWSDSAAILERALVKAWLQPLTEATR